MLVFGDIKWLLCRIWIGSSRRITQKQRECILPHADGFQNWVQRARKDTLGSFEAEMSTGVGLGLLCLPLSPVGSWVIPTPLQPDYTLLLGITLCHLAEKAAQTHQLSWVNQRPTALFHLPGSTPPRLLSCLPRLPLFIEICWVYWLSLCRLYSRCINKPQWQHGCSWSFQTKTIVRWACWAEVTRVTGQICLGSRKWNWDSCNIIEWFC